MNRTAAELARQGTVKLATMLANAKGTCAGEETEGSPPLVNRPAKVPSMVQHKPIDGFIRGELPVAKIALHVTDNTLGAAPLLA